MSTLIKYRAFTVSLVSRSKAVKHAGNDQKRCFADCANFILELVGPLAPKGQSEQLASDLEEVLVQAIKLSQTLRCQRASWSVRHVIHRASSNDKPVHFDESVMVNEREDTSDEDDPLYERLVEVVVSPALFKRGNTDGEQYDIETCIVDSLTMFPKAAPLSVTASQPTIIYSSPSVQSLTPSPHSPNYEPEEYENP